MSSLDFIMSSSFFDSKKSKNFKVMCQTCHNFYQEYPPGIPPRNTPRGIPPGKFQLNPKSSTLVSRSPKFGFLEIFEITLLNHVIPHDYELRSNLFLHQNLCRISNTCIRIFPNHNHFIFHQGGVNTPDGPELIILSFVATTNKMSS